MTPADRRRDGRFAVLAALDVAAVSTTDDAVVLARDLEAIGFDAVILGDPSDDPLAPAGFEPFTLAAALLAVTTRLGVIAGGRRSPEQPYHVARRTASLDHLSGGRSGWLVSDAPADQHGRTEELVEVVRGLWDSYADDALLRDADSGHFYDPARRRAIRHDGPYYRVRGPLNISRPPQGHPLVVRAAHPDPGADRARSAPDVMILDERDARSRTARGHDRSLHWLRVSTADDDAFGQAGAFDGVVLVPPRADDDPGSALRSAVDRLRVGGIVPSEADGPPPPSSRTLRDVLGLPRPDRSVG